MPNDQEPDQRFAIPDPNRPCPTCNAPLLFDQWRRRVWQGNQPTAWRNSPDGIRCRNGCSMVGVAAIDGPPVQ